MAWKLDSDRPIYTQILEVIQYQIVAGRYQPGERLPSVRDLASEAGVNPNTMQRAFAELERNGLVMAQRTSGRVVTENMEMISEVRNKLAREQIREFIDKMKKLGFEKKEILSLLEQDEKPKSADAAE
ncbi:MAG: GntR family transcriptional regulator [Lachnospiraceae bacterium]|nr:GntR family transcriptional regulator [Lachnospiraceae bacterium]